MSESKRKAEFPGIINGMSLHATTSGDLELKLDVRVQAGHATQAQMQILMSGLMEGAVQVTINPLQGDLLKDVAS